MLEKCTTRLSVFVPRGRIIVGPKFLRIFQVFRFVDRSTDPVRGLEKSAILFNLGFVFVSQFQLYNYYLSKIILLFNSELKLYYYYYHLIRRGELRNVYDNVYEYSGTLVDL